LLWSWYTIAGVAVASDYKAKALTAWSMLTGGGDHSTVTIVSTRLSSEDGGWLTAKRSEGEAIRLARVRLEMIAQRVSHLALQEDTSPFEAGRLAGQENRR
jgi:hypothetical protein